MTRNRTNYTKKFKLSIVFIITICLLLITVYFINLRKDTELEYLEPEWVVYYREDNYSLTRGNSVFVIEGSIFVAMEAIDHASKKSITILTKYDVNGAILWNRTQGVEYRHYRANDIFVNQGDIYLTGNTYGNDSVDAYIQKYNMDGDLVWNRTWGGQYYEHAHSICVLNGAIFITGTIIANGEYDVILLRYDQDGNLIWNRTWDADYVGSALSIHGADERIYVTGSTANNAESQYFDIFLLSYDMDGNLLWNRTHSENEYNRGESVFVNSDGIYVTGWSRSSDYTPYDVILLKYDREGDLIWKRTFDITYYDSANSIFIENEFIFLAGRTSLIGEEYDVLLLKLDKNGNILKKRYWGEEEEEYANSVFVEEGTIYLAGNAGSRAFLLKCTV